MMFTAERATRHSADKPAAAAALGLVLALSLGGGGEAWAQTLYTPTDCTPTQTVSDSPDADGRYTTTLVCANTAAAVGAADYRRLTYNQDTYSEEHGDPAVLYTNPVDRDTNIANNNANNNVAVVIGSGVVFTATGGADMRNRFMDGVINLWRGGAKSVTVREGATINIEQTPGGGGNYPSWSDQLVRTAGIVAQSNTAAGGDIDIEHNGVIEIALDIVGSPFGGGYRTSAGSAIHAVIGDNQGDETRAGDDITVNLGRTGVIRQRDLGAGQNHGMGGINAQNFAEDGDITVNLAKGSLIDLRVSSGAPAVRAYMPGSEAPPGNVAPQGGKKNMSGSISVTAAGTIYTRITGRGVNGGKGVGISTIHEGVGDTRIVSSGIIETMQAPGILGDARGPDSTQRDDPATDAIQGNLIDVTGGRIVSRGFGAIVASTNGAGDAWTIRVGEGATVRAEFDAPGGLTQAQTRRHSNIGWGNFYVNAGRPGWRLIDADPTIQLDGDLDSLEPIVRAISVGRDLEGKEDVVDRVIVDGTVETVGGRGEDAAIYFQVGGAAVTIGPKGKVISDTGVAIVSGCRPDARPRCTYNAVNTVAAAIEGDLSVTVERGGAVTGDIRVVNDGDLTVTLAGTVTGDLRAEGAGDLAVTVEEGGRIASSAMYAASGALDLTVAGRVTGDLRPPRHGALTLSVLEGGAVPGTVHDPAAATVAGSVGRVLYSNGGKITVARNGALTGIRTGGRLEALRSDAGTLDVTVAGRVEGDLRPPPGGTLKLSVLEGGVIPGTVHDPEGPLTVAGSVGRVIYSNGGKITVAATGALTGVETNGGVEALRADAGDLDVTVAGRVVGDLSRSPGIEEGDLRTPFGGALKLSVLEGGVVTGTVYDPEGPLTVAGSIGRVVYGYGGKVTVTETGALTGVETGGGIEALRSGGGDLDVTVAGRVAGDLRPPPGGRLKFAIPEGGVVTGTVRDPEGPLTVAGSIGRLLYSNGATVTVTETGRLTGVETDGGTEALRSASGDLYLTVAGTVTGDVFGLGAGEHEVTVAPNARVTGVIHLAASTALVDGTAGAVFLDRGGEVAVGRGGRITGVDGVGIRSATGDFTGTIEGVVVGDVYALGSGDRRVEVRSGGAVTGDVHVPNGDAAGEARVEVAAKARVAGVVEVPAPENLGLNGEVGRVVAGRGGVLTVGPSGAVTGTPTNGDAPGVSSKTGDLTVVVQVAPGETEADAMRRAPRRIEAAAGTEQVLYKLPESDVLRALGAFESGAVTPSGPFDLSVVSRGRGIEILMPYAPRAQVYEALPSVLLALHELSGGGGWIEAPRLSNDMRAQVASLSDTAPTPRLSNGMWARTQAFGGARDAKRSTSTEPFGGARDAKQSTSDPISLKYRGWGMEAGMDISLGDGALMSVSANRREVAADVSGDAGDINVVGNGLAASLAVDLADSVLEGMYAGARVSATSYSARLSSGPRGTLQRDADGVGHSVSLEAGRRMAWGHSDSLGEVTLTPRARVLYSRVDIDAFTDSVGARVSLKDGVAKTARAGLRVEALDRPAGSSLFGSVDVEREFAPETRVRVSGTDLKSESETTRVRVELGGSLEWGEGAYALQAAARYGSGADDYGGGVSLRMRF